MRGDARCTHKSSKPLKEGDSVLLFEPNLLKTTNKLTKGLAWTGPYRVEKVLPHNNVKLRDLRDNRAHDVVHMDRLRLWKGSKALDQDEYVLDELLNVRRVSPKHARGPSRMEFLVKWRQYTRADVSRRGSLWRN